MKFKISKFLELPQNDPEDCKTKGAPYVAYLTRPKSLRFAVRSAIPNMFAIFHFLIDHKC